MRWMVSVMESERMMGSGAIASDASTKTGGDVSVVPLDATGLPGLDTVLGGGVQRGSLVVVIGPPGAGKTILAHQIAFAAARAGRSVTILTAFAEPTHKLVAHMASLRFFDRDLLGGAVEMLSIQQFLKQGLAAAATEVVEVVRAAKSQLVVLDGFLGMRESTERPGMARQFVYDVSNRLSILGVTLLLTCETDTLDPSATPEAVTADVLLRLAYDIMEARERRTLEAVKVRGTTPLTGRHAFTIDGDGVTIYPRLEAQVAQAARVNCQLVAAEGHTPAPEATPSAPTLTGFPALDDLLQGGPRTGVGLLVTGGIAAGKTLLSLQFALAGVRAGERVLYANFHATAEQLVRGARAFTWGEELERAIASGQLGILRVPPIELRADVFVDNLLRLIDATGARRLALDDAGELESALRAYGEDRRFQDFFAALHEALRLRNVTALLTYRSPYARRAKVVADLGAMAAITENVLWLRRTDGHIGSPDNHLFLTILKSASAVATARLTFAISAGEGVSIGGGDALDATTQGASSSGKTRRQCKERRDDSV